jgi:hypothetical protein
MATAMPLANPPLPTQNQIPPVTDQPPPDQVVPPAANQNLIAGSPPKANPLYGPPGPPTPAERIRQMTRTSEPLPGPIWDTLGQQTQVSDRELTEIRGIVDRLDRTSANQTIGSLSDSDLRAIGTTINRETSRGSWTRLEREHFVRDLAGKLDEKQFSRVLDTFQMPPQQMATILANAQHGNTTDAKIAFMKANANNGEAVGTVLASMRNNPDAIRRAIGSTANVGGTSQFQQGALNNAQLQGALRGSLHLRETTGPYVTMSTHDFESIMAAAAASGDSALKARVFKAGAEQLGQVMNAAILAQRPNHAKNMADGLDRLLRSDTTGIVGNLINLDSKGSALATFAAQRLQDGNAASLGRMADQLRHGNILGMGPANPSYVNIPERGGTDRSISEARGRALSYGYGLGAIEAGMDRINRSAAERADLAAKIIATSSLRVVPADVADEVAAGTEYIAKQLLSEQSPTNSIVDSLATRALSGLSPNTRQAVQNQLNHVGNHANK